MRRRGTEFRRPVRRSLSVWIWLVLVLFVAAGLVLFVFHHHYQVQFDVPAKDLSATVEVHDRVLNFTEELLSTTSVARQLVDQLTLAKAYLVIAKERGNLKLAWELSSQIRACQQLLSEAAKGGNHVSMEATQSIVIRLSQLIYKAQDSHYDISTTIVTLKNHIQALEERVKAASLQSAEFGQLAVESVPKSLHCLNIKLTMQWVSDSQLHKVDEEERDSPRLSDNNLYHFCIFSNNFLATSVVVNSTVSNVDHPQQLVFHIVTDGANYRSMRAWFLTNNFRGSMIEVRNIEEFSWLNASYSPLIRQLQEVQSHDQYGEARPWDLNSMNLLEHLRFYIPEILPTLERVVFLDDDVVVQKDLTPLFSLDMHGNVNGAVETCLEAFHRYYNYLNFSSPLISKKIDPQACGWAFGMNVFDLIGWKKANVTARYHHWQEQNADHTLWKRGTLPPGLLTFYGLTEPLDRRWHVLGLAYDPDIDDRMMESATVVHFNGYMKPWLKMAIGRYRRLWEKYVNISHPVLQDCFVR